MICFIVIQKGLLHRYAARPIQLEFLCFCEFASNYKTATNKREQDENDPNSDSEGNTEPMKITLQDGMGNMVKRKNPAIVRSHQFSFAQNPEQLYHANLLLYFPWRNESTDIMQGSYREIYETHYDTIIGNKSKFEQNIEQLENAFEEIPHMGDIDEVWNILAPQTQQMRDEDLQEGAELIENPITPYESHTDISVNRDLGLPSYYYELSSQKMSNPDWYELILALNSKQYKLHQFIVSWCTKMLLSHIIKKPAPFHIFLTGGAGVGKSFLVRTMVQTITRLFSQNLQNRNNHVLVCAPTGAAAYNISGHTLQAAFQLPVIQI